MNHVPIFLVMEDRDALVVGGGAAAAAKVRFLARSGARITVVSPVVDDEVETLAEAKALTLARRPFAPDDVAGAALVISATGEDGIDRAVAEAAKAAGIPVNVVDRPDLSTFTVPAVVDRAPVTVAISTGGAAPVLARRLRAAIEALLPARLGDLARFAASFRGAVAAKLPSGRERRRFWERFFNGPLAEAVLAGDERRAREQMLGLVNRRRTEAAADHGIVHLVGAGPGDPDLMTVRALTLLRDADVIVHDRLVAPEILDRARRDAVRIDVGKSAGHHPWPQERINDLLVRLARSGERVVRLKGGDPFLFGRGGEEREHLLRHGVSVEVVPGITAATACGAVTGVSLTHRDLAHAVTFIAGQGKAGAPEPDWAAVARLSGSVVVYMGAGRAASIAERLIAGGLEPLTPAMVVVNGTRKNQDMALGCLAELEDLVARLGSGPKLMVIGDVVQQADASQALLNLNVATGAR